MTKLIKGLHHVTALAADAQENVDFYTKVLGLRVVKLTVNFDTPDVYHLYYGNFNAEPGSIMTFFPYGRINRGTRGIGEVNWTSFSVQADSLAFWMERLSSFNISYDMPQKRFNESYIRFQDYDGLGIELVAAECDLRSSKGISGIPDEFAVKGIYSVNLNEIASEKTIKLLTEVMDYDMISEGSGTFRLSSGGNTAGYYIDMTVNKNAPLAGQGAGSIHHIAFAVETEEDQLAVREKLMSYGMNVTTVLDRNYFKSIYFREPGGVLFEVATNPPGFTIDEDISSLGKDLKLPAWYEPHRETIKKVLPELKY